MLELPNDLGTNRRVRVLMPWAPAWAPSRPDRSGGDISRAFRGVVEHVPHGVVIFDEAGSIVVANRAAERIFGYAPAQLVGQQVEALLPEWRRVGTGQSPQVGAE